MSIFSFLRKQETRAAEEPSWDGVRGLSGLNTTPAGALVNPRQAEALSIVSSCVDRIADGVASLPVYIYREQDGGRDVDARHPLAGLVARGPNARQSWVDFSAWWMRQALLWGNGLVEIVTNGAGRLSELRPVPWWLVSPQLLPSGRMVYDVTDVVSIYGGSGRQRRLLDTEILHLRDVSDDGLLGRARLARAHGALFNALAVQEFSSAYMTNRALPSIVITTEANYSDDQRKSMVEQFKSKFTGPSKAGKILILDKSKDVKVLSPSAEDIELLDSRKFAAEEIARLFQVPPPLVGIWDNSSFTNSETAGRWFAQHTLGPWLRRIEAEIERKLLSGPSPRQVEFDLSGLLRGDPETRWKSHQIAAGSGILTPNEIREIEGWKPRPGGDELHGAAAAPVQASADPAEKPVADEGVF
ncbi:MAG: phage portal protein [Solidesulfovibrio sp.]